MSYLNAPKLFSTEPEQVSLGEDDGMSKLILNDGDLLAYRCSAPCDNVIYEVWDGEDELLDEAKYKKAADLLWSEYTAQGYDARIKKVKRPEPLAYALYNVDKAMDSIFESYQSEDIFMMTFLTGRRNFRKMLSTTYKAHRDPTGIPVHYNACKNHLRTKYQATSNNFMEADDLIGIHATRAFREGRAFSIASNDKDFNNFPGEHFNPVTKVKYQVTPLEALKNFYGQCMQGDTGDGVPGIFRMGPKTSQKLLKDCTSEWEMYQVGLKAWTKFLFPEEEVLTSQQERTVKLTYRDTARLVYILHEPMKMWSPPKHTT